MAWFTHISHVFLPPVHDQAISRCDYILSGSTRLDLQNLFQCRRAGWLEFVVAAGSLVASSCHAARAYRSLHGRSCLDFDLLVLSPLSSLARMRWSWTGGCEQLRNETKRGSHHERYSARAPSPRERGTQDGRYDGDELLIGIIQDAT